MENKKIILLWLFILSFLGFSFAQVSLDPIYSSERFKPFDKFHAGCENQINVVFDLQDALINGVNAVLEYNNDDISISKIIAPWEKENNLSYVVEDQKITFNKLKTDNDGLDKVIFQLFFESEVDLSDTSFMFVTGSYIVNDLWDMIDLWWNYSFEFASVPECNPDIIAPSIDLLFPQIKTWSYAALDSYFQFKINDQGKWINKDSIKISIDGIKYDMSNIEHEWDEDVLTIYPDNWLAVGSEVPLNIQVEDKQVYGKSNLTYKEFTFQTSTWLYLLNEIDPVQFRKLVNKEKYYKWSVEECELISKYYNLEDDAWKEILMSINKRLSCPEIVENVELIMDNGVEEEGKYSVFAVLGWIMFGLLFTIRLFSWLGRSHKHNEDSIE